MTATDEPFELYYDSISQPSRTILLFMKLINAPLKAHFVDLGKGQHLEPEFLAINPFHKVPYLLHGNFSLSESPAITRYIFNVVKPADHWYPADVKKRAKVDEYLSYQHTTIRSAGTKVMFAYHYTTKMTGRKVEEEEKQTAMKEFDETLAKFEAYFLKDGSFIAGNEISIADLFALSEILQANMSKTDYLANRPVVREWIERVKAETKPHFDEVFDPFEEFVKTI